MDFSRFSNPKLKNGKSYGVVISALSKSIRRGRVEEALWCATALFDTFSGSVESSQQRTFQNYKTRFRNRLVIALLEDHTPSAPWLVEHALRAYVSLRDNPSDTETKDVVCRAVQEACLAPTSRLLQHIRNCGRTNTSHPAVRIVLSLDEANAKELKNRALSLHNSRVRKISELCGEFIKSGNKDRTRFVIQASALMDYAVRNFEGVRLEPSTVFAPLRIPREPPWPERPEFFDMHVPIMEMSATTKIKQQRTNRGFVEREEHACRSLDRAHAELAKNPLALALQPIYDEWRFKRDS